IMANWSFTSRSLSSLVALFIMIGGTVQATSDIIRIRPEDFIKNPPKQRKPVSSNSAAQFWAADAGIPHPEGGREADQGREDGRWGHRDATLVLIAFRHGLRASEVCELEWLQVEFG